MTVAEEKLVQVNAGSVIKVLPEALFGEVAIPAMIVAVVAEPCPERVIVKSAVLIWLVRPCCQKPPGYTGCWYLPLAPAQSSWAEEEEAFAAGYANPLANRISAWVPE